MNDLHRIERRSVCAAMLAVGGTLLTAQESFGAPPSAACEKKPELCFKNAEFYDAGGTFDEDVAKEAYYKLMQAAGFPISEFVRQNLWIAEFGLGRFTEVGLGGVFWVNEKKWNYASVEIFLLPNQMIPEHWHVAIESEGVTPKMESWVVRYGTSYAYSEGEPTMNLQVRIHEREAKHITVRNETVLNVGHVTGLARPLEKHWQQAGPQGAIVTEVSTYHAGEAVKYTNPEIKS